MKLGWMLFMICVAAWVGSQSVAFAGPGISAGGNGIDGRPLESYAINVRRRAEYIQYVAPVFYRLQQKLPGLASDLAHVIDTKNFYLVPAELPNVPRFILGVSFRTDQIALQTDGAVWIDQELYEHMAPRDQALLLIHELVMGLRLAGSPGSWECTPSPLNRMCRGSDLDRTDYEAVRRLSVVLINDLDRYDSTSFRALISSLGYPSYPLPVETSTGMTAATPQELYFALLTEDRQQALPYRTQDNTGCAYEFAYTGDTKTFKISIYDRVNGQARRDRLPLTVNLNETLAVSQIRNGLQYTATESVAAPSLGSFRRRVDISLNGDAVTQIDAYWEEYGFDFRTRGYRWNRSLNGPAGTLVPNAKNCLY